MDAEIKNRSVIKTDHQGTDSDSFEEYLLGHLKKSNKGEQGRGGYSELPMVLGLKLLSKEKRSSGL